MSPIGRFVDRKVFKVQGPAREVAKALGDASLVSQLLADNTILPLLRDGSESSEPRPEHDPYAEELRRLELPKESFHFPFCHR